MNKNIYLLGKSRAFNSVEFKAQLDTQNYVLQDEFSDQTQLVIEGALMSALNNIERDEIYEKHDVSFMGIGEFEKLLSSHIDEDTLLMSLKLNYDETRVINFLKNPYLSDSLFLKLIKSYKYKNEGFFDSDENRDVSSYLISRFYKNIERNHNIQYSNMGFMHLLEQSDNEELVSVISELEPIKNFLKNGCSHNDQKLLNALASHPKVSKKFIKRAIKSKNDDIKQIISMRSDLECEFIKELYPTHANIIAMYVKLDEKKFVRFKEEYTKELCVNETLTEAMFDDLVKDSKNHIYLAQNENLTQIQYIELYHKSKEVDATLAQNHYITSTLVENLYKDEANHIYLASNPKTPVDILQAFSDQNNKALNEALAQNSSTPIDVLYNFLSDLSLSKYVKSNKAFGQNIKTENIGWL